MVVTAMLVMNMWVRTLLRELCELGTKQSEDHLKQRMQQL